MREVSFSYIVDARTLSDNITSLSSYQVVSDYHHSMETAFLRERCTLSDISINIQFLFIMDFCYTVSKSFVLDHQYANLVSINIGSGCFHNVNRCVMNDLPCLENVIVGQSCFGKDEHLFDIGCCYITNCPKLCRLRIGNHSFEYFRIFQLAGVGLLQSVSFGKGCFAYSDFSLQGML